MKLKLLLTVALLFGLSSHSFAQDTTPPSPVAVSAFDAGPMADAMPAAPAPVVEAPAPAEAAPKAAPAEAAPSGETGLSKLSSSLMDIIIPAFSTLILGLFAVLLAWVRKKLKLDVSNQTIYQWSDVIRKAIARGDEWARNKAKDLADGKKVPGPDILDVSLDWAIEAGRAYGLPEMGREKLIGLLESQLHLERQDASHVRPLELDPPTNPAE